jgi:hypothetical protein
MPFRVKVSMKRRCMPAVVVVFVFAVLLAAGGAAAQGKSAPVMRELAGQVTTRTDAPLPEAIVYLKNTKTLAVKTYIADAEGNYHFPGLSPNIDYEVSAEYHGKRSATKILSSFDSRTKATINLKIDATP